MLEKTPIIDTLPLLTPFPLTKLRPPKKLKRALQQSMNSKTKDPSKIPMKEAVSYWTKYIFARKWTYLLGIATVAGTNVVDVFIPKLVQLNIDNLQATHAFSIKLFWALLLTFVFQFCCRVVWRRTLALQTFRAAGDLKKQVWDKARFFPLSLFHKRLTRGELINLATGDVTYAQNTFGFHFVASTDFIFLFTLSVSCMFYINARLTLISLVLFPIIPFLVFFLCEKESRLYDESQNSLTKLNDTVDSIVGASKLMKLQPHAPLWNQRLDDASRAYQSKRATLVKTEAQFFPATALPPAFSVAFFLFYGLSEFKAGHLTLGQLVAFHSYLFMIADPLSELGWLVSDWQKSFTSLQRLLTVFREPKDPIFSSVEDKVPGKPPVQIEGLKFSFDGKLSLLHIPTLELNRGQRLGIRGEVGSGKSTLGKIIAGLETHYAGSVKVFGTEVRDLKNTEIRRLISLVDQNPFLFGTSVRENLTLDNALSDEELWYWLEVVDLVEDFKKLPNGLESHLGEWGVNLSGGQRQRLTLARALCRKPELIIFDDALSAIDIVTEEKIIHRLEKSLKDLSVILISHRDSSLNLCHRQVDLSLTEVEVH
jgi:ATP-binding cassette subfamily B multidrug efflux pump